MKPMRGLPGSWLTNLPKERRAALVSLAVLLALLGSLVLYQRLTMLSNEIPVPDPGVDVPVDNGTTLPQAPPAVDEIPVASGAGTGVQKAEVTRLEKPVAGTPQVRLKFDDIHDALGGKRIYTALAYAAKPGDSVLAAGPGTVVDILESPIDGRVVLIDHGNDLMTRYAGLGKTLVTKGATVTTGTILAQVGEPGPVWTHLGAHLQFQVLLKGQAVNPVSYFPN